VIDKADVEKTVEWIRSADSILIGAGAGLSADAGADYGDTQLFARNYPGMVKRGFHKKLELIGYTGWSEALKWGYLAQHVNEVRFQATKHPIYEQLLDIVRDKDYFVITTNVDAMFVKNGFDTSNIYTPQGDYAMLQCEAPCTREVWPIKPFVDAILPVIDHRTQEVTDPSVIPRCPNCGGPVFMNVRGGDWFIDEPYLDQAEKYHAWVESKKESHVVLIEIGAGFNTPVWIRWPMEEITYQYPAAKLIRINLLQPDTPSEIAAKSIKFKEKAVTAISAIWNELQQENS